MTASLKPGLDRAVGARPEAVEVGRDGAVGEVRDALANPRLELGERKAIERRRRQRRQAVVP